MTGRWLALSLVVAIACSHQVSPVEPSLSVGYRSLNPDVYGDRQVAEGAQVLVGLPIEINGSYSAACAGKELFYKNDNSPEIVRSCKTESADVIVSCVGPCAVDGHKVTPTGPGQLALTIDLASNKSSRHTSYRRVLHAVVAEDFQLECIGEPTPTAVNALCRTWASSFRVNVLAAGKAFAAPVHANGSLIAAERDGTTISLARLLGAPPSSPKLPAPGIYRVELRYGALARSIEVEVDDRMRPTQ